MNSFYSKNLIFSPTSKKLLPPPSQKKINSKNLTNDTRSLLGIRINDRVLQRASSTKKTNKSLSLQSNRKKRKKFRRAPLQLVPPSPPLHLAASKGGSGPHSGQKKKKKTEPPEQKAKIFERMIYIRQTVGLLFILGGFQLILIYVLTPICRENGNVPASR